MDKENMEKRIKVERFGELLSDWVFKQDKQKNQKWLASQIGLSESSISNFISGKIRPSLETVKKIQEVTGIKFLVSEK